jgi:hypothetical protein
MAERSNAAVLKTVDCYRSGGSNPSLSALTHRSFSEGGLRKVETELISGWVSADGVRSNNLLWSKDKINQENSQ